MSESTAREEQTTKKRKKKKKEAEMSFLEHLEELRWHIIRFVMKEFIFDTIILAPKSADFWTNRMFAKLGDLIGSEAIKINQQDLNLIAIKMADQFMMHIMVSI